MTQGMTTDDQGDPSRATDISALSSRTHFREPDAAPTPGATSGRSEHEMTGAIRDRETMQNVHVSASATDDFPTLMALASQGNSAALATLVKRYEPEVRMAARVMLGPALRPYLDSVDLVQSVHHSVLKGLQRDRFEISQPEQLLALALTIVRRKVARHWRKVRRQLRSETNPTPISEQGGEGLASLSSPQSDPTAPAQFDDQMAHLQRLLDPTERKLIEMRLLGHSTAEVARSLGLDADVLRVRLHRLRVRLRSSGLLDDWF